MTRRLTPRRAPPCHDSSLQVRGVNDESQNFHVRVAVGATQILAAMDIDDLLAEVTVDTSPQETRDLQELTRSWVAERVAPELLPWPLDLMDRVLERIRQQVLVTEPPVVDTEL